MSHFRDEKRLYAVREGRADVWLSGDPELRSRQLETRRARMADAGEPMSDAEAVLVLVEMIRCPGADVDELVRTLAARGTPVSPVRVCRLLERHGLAGKGAPDSARHGR
jgi:hypothetical protein